MAIFGRRYAAEPEVLIEQLLGDHAIAEADTLLPTVPNQLGVACDAHVMEAILTTVAPAPGWRSSGNALARERADAPVSFWLILPMFGSRVRRSAPTPAMKTAV